MAAETHLLVVPHTHWDREWYLTFQQFRMRLVRTVDLVLDTLEADSAFTHFMLDGQTIVLEDYLEVRPENAGRLQSLARQGRLQIGPWYLQPDEFLVGGESLIRNLLVGRRMGADYGGVMPVGYVPDTFGHIAQLPQILRGFGIDNAVFWRGVPPGKEKGAFTWTAPDGAQVLVAWLYDDFGYSNAASLPLDPESLAARARLIAARMAPRAVIDTSLLMNGTDHMEPQPGLPEAIAKANQLLAPDGIDLAIGTLPDYIARLKQTHEDLPGHTGEFRSSHSAHLLPGVLSTRMWLKQRNATCEALLTRWAEPAASWAWALGRRYPGGLLSIAWRRLLHNHPHDSICGCGIDEVHAEMMPRFAESEQIGEGVTAQALAALAARVDTRGPAGATPIVVFNPAGGPRTDAVRCEVVLLSPDAELVDDEGRALPYQVLSARGGVLLDERVDKGFVAGVIGTASEGQALGYSILDAHLDVPAASDTAELRLTVSQNVSPDLAVVARLLPQIQALLQRPEITAFRVVAREAEKSEILLLARDVPQYGGRVLFLRPRAGAVPNVQRQPAETSPLSRSVFATETVLENAHLRVAVDEATGTFTLSDKRTGRDYAGLNRFVDTGDVGDLYNYSPPARDVAITAPAWPPRLALIEAGPARATIRVSATYMLPNACTPDRAGRSGALARCDITTDISLTAGARRVELRATVENAARDHRLRAFFPVPFVARSADAEDAFCVTRRPARREPQPGEPPWSEWIEAPVDTNPQKRFVDLSDGSAGLAVLNRGLPEYEVAPSDDGASSAVALTLLRCVEWLSRDDLATRRGHAGPPLHTPAGQGIGTHVFEYALVPHAGAWEAEDAVVLQEAHAYEAPLRALAQEQRDGDLPGAWSFVHVAPGAVIVSAVKRSERGDGLIVRIVNMVDRDEDAEVILARPFDDVALVTLSEDAAPPTQQRTLARILSTGVRTRLRGGEIQTLLFRLSGVRGEGDEGVGSDAAVAR
jgi:mannosylglycerate hydrolase